MNSTPELDALRAKGYVVTGNKAVKSNPQQRETTLRHAKPDTSSKQQPKGKQRGRGVNKLEMRLYAWLKQREARGEVRDIITHPPRFPIGHRCTYEVDYVCFNIGEGCWEIHEAKNYWVKFKDDGGWVKLKSMVQQVELLRHVLYYEPEHHPYVPEFWADKIKKFDIRAYLFSEGKDKQVWIHHVPPIGETARRKVRE